jgi:uncharacterized protein (DUF736 family)
MATIGTFSRAGTGNYTGSVKTLDVKSVKFIPAEGDNEKGPDFRVFTGTTEFGAAWKKRSDKGNDYLSVKLDDPSFASPIYASLVEAKARDWRSSGRADAPLTRIGHRPSPAQAGLCHGAPGMVRGV